MITLDETIRRTLSTQSDRPFYFYTEYLDVSVFDGDVPQRELGELLRRKYGARSLDLVLAVGSRALRIALRNRADLFGDAPIVYTALDRIAAAGISFPPDVTGIVSDIVMPGRIEATAEILRRQPGTPVVLVTMHDDPGLVERGRAAGALGHVLRLAAARELKPAVHAALRRERYVSSGLRERPRVRAAGADVRGGP